MRASKRLLWATLFLVLLCAPRALCQVRVSEIMAQNGVYANGHAYDWIELYNDGKKAVSLAGWTLCDESGKSLTFDSSARIAAGGYTLVYCVKDDAAGSEKNAYYAPFGLDADGETVTLRNAAGDAEDTLCYPSQYGNIAYGLPSGGGACGYFSSATPGKKNDKTAYAERAEAPVLSQSGGAYDKSVRVGASAGQGAILRYTTDGTEPTEKSKKLTGTLTITKTTALRVRAFESGRLPSETASATYLVGENVISPVVALITDEKYLFDEKTGALARGTGSVPNYDKEWEYPIFIEYFDEHGARQIAQGGTFTASGHSARQNKQKSIALYARDAFGLDRFYFNPFENRDYDSYKSLLLRSANSDAFSTRLRDPYISSLSQGLDLCYQDARAIEVYINGRYWGHYNLREKINKHMVAQWEGVTDKADIDSIDILARTGSDAYVQNGDNADWLSLMDFCRTHDLNVPENLAYVEQRLDVDSLFAHSIFEMIIGNKDMTNVRVYRVPGGKWKYLLFDVEAGLMSYDEEPISWYIKAKNAKTARFQHVHLSALLEVPQMRDKFLSRFAEILQNNFSYTVTKPKLDFWVARVSPLLDKHNARWKNFSVKTFEQNVSAVRNYTRLRPIKIIDKICSAMKLTKAEREAYFGAVEALLKQDNYI